MVNVTLEYLHADCNPNLNPPENIHMSIKFKCIYADYPYGSGLERKVIFPITKIPRYAKIAPAVSKIYEVYVDMRVLLEYILEMKNMRCNGEYIIPQQMTFYLPDMYFIDYIEYEKRKEIENINDYGPQLELYDKIRNVIDDTVEQLRIYQKEQEERDRLKEEEEERKKLEKKNHNKDKFFRFF